MLTETNSIKYLVQKCVICVLYVTLLIQNIVMLQSIAEHYHSARRRQICLCFIGLLKKSYQHQIISARYLSVYQITLLFFSVGLFFSSPP